MLELGSGDADKTWMKVNKSNILEGFELVKLTDASASLFGCRELQLAGGSTGLLGSWAFNEPNGGFWTVDGVACDPRGTFSRDTSKFYVVSFSSERATTAENIGSANGSVQGSRRLGEVIYYNRHLTDLERRQTIAYLMRKWKGVTTDFAQAQTRLGTVSFPADNAAPRLHAEADTVITSLKTVGQASLTKTGAGKLTVEGGTLPSCLDSLSVEGELDFGGKIDALPEMAFHVDASRHDTFEFSGDGKDGSPISRWYDCRRNGLYAKGNVKPTSGTKEPVYKVLTTATGGLLANSAYVDMNDKAGMYWYDGTGTKLKFADLAEFHVVFRRPGSGTVIGGPVSNQSALDHMIPRNDINVFFGAANGNSASKLADSESDWHNNNYWLKSKGNISADNFYVFSFVMSGGNRLQANSFGVDRDSNYVGVHVCEAMILRAGTNDMVRARQIHGYLMKKWKGIDLGTVALPTQIGEVRMTGDAKVNLHSDLAFATPKLSGNGTFDAAKLTDVALLDVAIDAAGTVETKTIDGSVSFADTLAVAFDVAAANRVRAGTFVLLKAKGGFDNRPASVAVSGLSEVVGRCAYRMTVADDEIRIEFTKGGLTVLVR